MQNKRVYDNWKTEDLLSALEGIKTLETMIREELDTRILESEDCIPSFEELETYKNVSKAHAMVSFRKRFNLSLGVVRDIFEKHIGKEW